MLKKLKAKKSKGFTMVELIVVVGILMVLSVLAVTAFGDIQDEAKLAALKSDAGALASALNNLNYYADTKVDDDALDSHTNGVFTVTGVTFNGASKDDMSVAMSVAHADDCVAGAVIYTASTGVFSVASDTVLKGML